MTGAVNTLVPGPGGTWAGFNTDVYGIVQAFREGMDETRGEDGGALPGETRGENGGGVFGTRAVFGGASAFSAGFEGLIFGSGSTAASAVAAMVQLGVRRLSVVSRHPSPQTPVAQAATAMGVRLGQVSWQDSARLQQLCHNAHLVMNTIPGTQQSQLELPSLHRGAVVLDAAGQIVGRGGDRGLEHVVASSSGAAETLYRCRSRSRASARSPGIRTEQRALIRGPANQRRETCWDFTWCLGW